MGALKVGLSAAVAIAAFGLAGCSSQAPAGNQGQVGGGSAPGNFLQWPLPPGDRAYGAIDGKQIWQYVVQQAAISRRYRDQGHQFWGRIIGTSGDAESAQWLLNNFNQIGMTDTHIQPIDLLPQWMAQSWDVSVTAGEKTQPLASAQPVYRSPGTQGQGMDRAVVWVGEGTESDFVGRDVRGKAVFISSVSPPGFCPQCAPTPDRTSALTLAEKKGAAAIFDIYTALPGNLKYQSYPTNTNVPTFTLGTEDGKTIQNLFAQASAGHPPHVKLRLDVKMVPNLKTALVWGTLPGSTDETIYVIAHRDGWFDASGDNAGGVASMIGVAEYFAKIPKSQRRRTMVFIGIDGHHNSGPGAAAGSMWLVAHRAELFSKTALMFNDEHPANVIPYLNAGKIGLTDAYVPIPWYAGGSSRPNLEKIASDAFREFGVTTWDEPTPAPLPGDMGRFYRFLPGIEPQSNDFLFFHTDANTPETVPWTALEAMTRAYAKIIDQVNKLELKDLQRPEEAAPKLAGD